MRVKNLNFSDKYTEKLVLGASVIYLILVAWFFVFSNPFRVEIGNRMLGPGEADQYVNQQADRLARALDGPVPEPLRNPHLPAYADLFAARLQAPITPPATREGVPDDALAYAPWAGNRAKLPEIDIRPPQREPFITPKPPTPSPVVAQAELVQIDMDEAAAEARAALTEHFGRTPPYDAQWVTVRSALNLADFRNRLLDPQNDQARGLPRLWLDSIVVLDVQVERRPVFPDGKYGQPEMLPPMPGRASFRAALRQEQIGDRQATRLLGRARDAQHELLTPGQYPLAAGFSDLPATKDRPTPEPGTPDGPPAGEEPNPGFEGPGPAEYDEAAYYEEMEAEAGRPTPPRAGAEQPPADENRETDRETDEAADEAEAEAVRLGSRWGGSVFAQDRLALWTTDLAVEPAARYQYRVRVVTSNPLFQRTQVPESQQELAETFALTGPWSDWSETIELPQKRYFFVIGGSPELEYVQVECWRFFSGLWRAATFQVRPGDPIGRQTGDYRLLRSVAEQSPPESVDFFQDAYAVDIDYNYPLAGPQLGSITAETIRLIYTEDQALRDRLERNDQRRREQVADRLDLTLEPR